MLSEYRAGRMSAVNDFPTADAVLHIICSSTESDVSFERIMFFIEDGIIKYIDFDIDSCNAAENGVREL